MSATLSLPAVMKMGLRWSTSRCLGGADANANDDRVLLARAKLQTLVELKKQPGKRRTSNGTWLGRWSTETRATRCACDTARASF
jgi:hypothetical protein